jgi:hypothetical protein
MTKRVFLGQVISVVLLARIFMGQTSPASGISARELYDRPVKKTSVVPQKGAQVVPVGDVTLAMRYHVLKKTGTRFEEVDSDSTFTTGDVIKIRVALNSPGYVYIAQTGSGGTWTVLFPSGARDGDEILKPNLEVEIPKESFGFMFDANPGVEKLFVAASRQPIPDLKQAISVQKSLTVNGTKAPGPASSHEEPPVRGGGGSILMEPHRIADSRINDVRRQAGDLVLQKIDDASTRSHAVYVSTRPNSNSDLVVADLTLNHRR